MKEFLQRTKLMTALTSILLIILGILLITNPTGAVLTVCRIVAVSYTHLDVYKRQGLISSMRWRESC